MTTKEMFDKGVHCKGQGFNCYNCKLKRVCVEFVNMDVKEKPPLGLMQHDIWELKRYQDIKQAMGRYANVDMEIPKEWVDEYIILSRKIMK